MSSAFVNEHYSPDIYLSTGVVHGKFESDDDPYSLYFIPSVPIRTYKSSVFPYDTYDYPQLSIKLLSGTDNNIHYKYPKVSPSGQLLVFQGNGTHLTDRRGKNEKVFTGYTGPYDFSSNSEFIYAFGDNKARIINTNGELISDLGSYESYTVSADKTIILLQRRKDGGE